MVTQDVVAAEISPSFPPAISISNSVQRQASPSMTTLDSEVVQKLQKWADLCRLHNTARAPWVQDFPSDCKGDILKEIAITHTELHNHARDFIADGNHRDAIHVYSQMRTHIHLDDHSLRVDQPYAITLELVGLHEKLGDFAAAEKVQEEFLCKLDEIYLKNPGDIDYFVDAIEKLDYLYTRFYLRSQELITTHSSTMMDIARLTVFRRTVYLEIDELSYKVLSNATIGLPAFPLHLAARIGATKIVKILLDKYNLDINIRNGNGSTAVQEAAQANQSEALRILLEHNADTNTSANNKETPLHSAVRTGSLECARILLEKSVFQSALILAKDDKGRTALHLGVNIADEDMVTKIINAGASVEAGDLRGRTALNYAVKSGNEGMVSLLLDAGAPIEARNLKGMTALMSASREDSLPVAQCLIRAGADLESRNHSGLTPFLIAIEDSTAAMVTFLMTKDANIEARDNLGRTALHVAVSREPEEEAERVLLTLLERQINKDATDDNGETPLGLAARLDHLPQARILLDHEASLELGDDSKETPLHKAVQSGHDCMTLLLLEKGANVEAKDLWGRTPLWIVAFASSRNKETVRILLDHGASVKDYGNREPFDGSTILHFAIGSEFLSAIELSIVELLLNAGADANVKNSLGETPLHQAMRGLERRNGPSGGSPEQLVGMLLDHGALPQTRARYGETPLYHALKQKRPAVVKMLLKAVLAGGLVGDDTLSDVCRHKLDDLCGNLTSQTEFDDEDWHAIEENLVQILGPLSHYDEKYVEQQHSFSIKEPLTLDLGDTSDSIASGATYGTGPEMSTLQSTNETSLEL